jgi:hypothetical protein
LLLLEPQQLHRQSLVQLLPQPLDLLFQNLLCACIVAHCAFVGRDTAGRAAVGAKPAAGKTAARTATAVLLAAGNADVAAVGVTNATCLASANRAAVTTAAGGAALAAGRDAVTAADDASVAAARVATAACLVDAFAAAVAGTDRAAVASARAATADCLYASSALVVAAAAVTAAAVSASSEPWWVANCPVRTCAEDYCRRSQCAGHLRTFQKPVWPRRLL